MNGLLVKFDQDSGVRMILSVGALLCLLLLTLRIFLTGDLHYAFLAWNLFLAFIPLRLANTIARAEKEKKQTWLLCTLFFIWLLFFPNAPYILTDLFHLRPKQNIPLWFDLILIVSFAWSGLMHGFISLLKIQQVLNKRFKSAVSWCIVVAILFLSAFGIYLGRFERWNSWDIVLDPFSLLGDIFERLVNPFSYPSAIGVTLLFSVFLIVSYLTLFFLIKSKNYEEQ